MTASSILNIPMYGSGLITNKKAHLIPDDAFAVLKNAYVWRDRTKRREGLRFLGRLQRNIGGLAFFPIGASPWSFELLVQTGYVEDADNGNPGQVTTTYPHNLQDGDIVTFSYIQGATGYNNNSPFTITVVDVTTFTVGADATGYGTYTGGGQWISNRPLRDTEPNASLVPGSVIVIINPTPSSGNITGVTNAEVCVVTSASHGLTTGKMVTITGVLGMVEINDDGPYTVTVIDADNFSIDRNSLDWGVYTSGGLWVGIASADAILRDQGDGLLLADSPSTDEGIINYVTGEVVVETASIEGVPSVVSFSYYPGLPAMTISDRDIQRINDEQTLFFDTKYAYIFSNGNFQEYLPGTAWDGTDSDFYWTTNYRGVTSATRLFFVTNNVTDPIRLLSNLMRYTDGNTWTDFIPFVNAAEDTIMVQARILIPFFGRLLAFNTTEGSDIEGLSNYFNRCRFSAIGDPTQADAWKSDVFGQGGFLDAPTNEAIVSATFFKNTLIVGFERSTWQLRYVGEYGLPFLWERISSDFGTDSTFSSVIFDDAVLSVSTRAIVGSDSISVQRIDTNIPDEIFNFQVDNFGFERVQGVRDFEKELVFWNYIDSQLGGTFPNSVLVYNYRNNTFATFRDNVTCFGRFQADLSSDAAITWDAQTVNWDDEEVTWDDPQTQFLSTYTVSGNQQGYVHYYGYTTPDEASLAIQDVDMTVTPNQLVIPSHNLQDGEIIYVSRLIFLEDPIDPLHNRIFKVTVIDSNTISLSYWDYDDQFYYDTPATGPALYVGGGEITLFPKLDVQTKDFSPYQQGGKQWTLNQVDFLMDVTPSSAMTVNLFTNTSPSSSGNLLTGNKEVETFTTLPYYIPASDIAWHSFQATAYGQFIRVQMTYDDDLMNALIVHEQDWVLNSMRVYHKIAGSQPF